MKDLFPFMNLIRRLADNTSPRSLAARLRKKRFRHFRKLISAVEGTPLKILDVGGTPDFWKKMDFLPEADRAELTLLNLFKTQISHPHFTTILGDGRDMKEFSDRQFDLVFSNSVIEHVGGFPDQKKMANEIRRVGNGYFVQTPNLYFPIEPHFLFPFFQFLPLRLRSLLLKHFRVGWHGPTRDTQKATQVALSVRLLGKAELARLFPDAQICEEKLLGFTKSLIAFRPWSPERGKGAARPLVRARDAIPEKPALEASPGNCSQTTVRRR